MENIFLENVARGIKYGVKPRLVKPKWQFNGDKASHVASLREKDNLTIEVIPVYKFIMETAIC